MRKLIAITAALFLSGVSLIASSGAQSNRTRIFRSAEVVSASGVGIPFNSVANGIVELYLTIGETGNVEDVRVARPLASVTEEAVRSVKTWKFDAATMRGKPVESRLTVFVVFCPLAYQTPDLPLTPIAEEARQPAAGVLPSVSPEVIEAKYPPDGNARSFAGTVVLRVLVGSDGQPGLVRVVKDAPTMTESARIAVAGWKFTPARVNGKEVISGVVVAFAFRSPLVNNSY
jgi:outer membrane biosynthesis protein TonB